MLPYQVYYLHLYPYVLLQRRYYGSYSLRMRTVEDTLGLWNTNPVPFNLKEEATPSYGNPI